MQLKAINDYEEYSRIISPKLKKIFYTNNFLSETDVKREIDDKTLFYSEVNNDLYIFRKRKNHLIMTYYLTLNDKIPDFSENIVTEIAYKIYPENIVEFFEKYGMRKYIQRVRLSKEESCEYINSENITLCQIDDAKEVSEILNRYFDKFSGCIPTEKSLINDIINKNIYVYKQDKILGILRFYDGNLSSEIKHLIVIPEARKKGVAKGLVSKYLEESIAKNKRVWTGIDNESAINVYKKMGYVEDGYKSIVLIKERES